MLPVKIEEGVALLDEDFRHRLTEAVDALLNIPDHEQVVLSGNTAENHVLGGIGVLILVDQHKGKALGQLLCQRGTQIFSVFLPNQQLHRKMLQIRKIQQTALALGIHQPAVIVENQLKQRLDAGTQEADVLQKILLAGAEQPFAQLG